MQHADAKFERKDPFPQIPFAIDERDALPTAQEAIGWAALGFCFVVTMLGFLGAA